MKDGCEAGSGQMGGGGLAFSGKERGVSKGAEIGEIAGSLV